MAEPPDKAPSTPQGAIEFRDDTLRQAFESVISRAGSKLDASTRHMLVEETVEVAVQLSGPIPPAFILRGYDEALPGLADRIVAMSEVEQGHAHDMQRRGVLYPFIVELGGLIAGVLVTCAMIGTAAYCITHGQPEAGLGLFGATAAGIVFAFIRGRGAKAEPSKSKQIQAQRDARRKPRN